MKSVIALSVLTLAVLTAAQDITTLPQCAQQPILNAITNSGCPLTDITCICGNQKFISGLLAQIPSVCNPAEVEVTAQFAKDLCFGYGVPLELSISGHAVGTSIVSSIGSSTSVSAPASTTTSGSASTTSKPATPANTGTATAATSTGTAAAASSNPKSASTINSVGSDFSTFVVVVGICAFLWT